MSKTPPPGQLTTERVDSEARHGEAIITIKGARVSNQSSNDVSIAIPVRPIDQRNVARIRDAVEQTLLDAGCPEMLDFATDHVLDAVRKALVISYLSKNVE